MLYQPCIHSVPHMGMKSVMMCHKLCRSYLHVPCLCLFQQIINTDSSHITLETLNLSILNRAVHRQGFLIFARCHIVASPFGSALIKPGSQRTNYRAESLLINRPNTVAVNLCLPGIMCWAKMANHHI